MLPSTKKSWPMKEKLGVFVFARSIGQDFFRSPGVCSPKKIAWTSPAFLEKSWWKKSWKKFWVFLARLGQDYFFPRLLRLYPTSPIIMHAGTGNPELMIDYLTNQKGSKLPPTCDKHNSQEGKRYMNYYDRTTKVKWTKGKAPSLNYAILLLCIV
jgi:hypothetical protein